MNNLSLWGRLTKDVELKHSDGSDFTYTRFTVAVQRNYKNKDGEYEADFINCAAFGKTAEFLAKYFSKGQSVGIVGRIQSRKWDEDGTMRYGMEVIAKEVFFAGGKASEKKQESNNEFAADVPLEFSGSNDDLPF